MREFYIMDKSLKINTLDKKKSITRSELTDILGEGFSGQITAYKIEETGTKFHDILFYEDIIFTRNYKVGIDHNSDIGTELMSMERYDSMDEVVIDYLHMLISEEGYDYEIEH
jgi:hypothetical protein